MALQAPEDSTAAIDAAVLAVSDVVREQMTALVQSRDAQIEALTTELADVKARRVQELTDLEASVQALQQQIDTDQGDTPAQTGA